MIVRMKNLSFKSLYKFEKTLGPLESQIMEIIWKLRRATVREVLGNNHKKLAYTTIMTVMDNLYKKGLLNRQMIKKTYYYFPVVEEKKLSNQSLKQVLNILFKQYGRRTVLFILLFTLIPFNLNSNFILTRRPQFFGFSLTTFFAFFTLSLWQLFESLTLNGTLEYLKLLLNDPQSSFNQINLFLSVFWENFPVINLLTLFLSLIALIFSFKKASKLINFKNVFNLSEFNI